MIKTWATFEERVRGIASLIWQTTCEPRRIGGVNVDGVVAIDAEQLIYIEITEEKNLGKVREDIIKLLTAKNATFASNKFARCYCIVNGSVTEAMKDAGKPHHIKVMSVVDFTKQFFDFNSYKESRSKQPFGSAVNPLTGTSDETSYVPVRYTVENRNLEVSSADIAAWITEGKKIVLLGEYGSGKSRCIREIFNVLSEQAGECLCYPIAIDLRKSWGLKTANELLRRHFSDLGLDQLAPSAVRAFKAGSVALLLDGFDEVGSQAWSNDIDRLKVIRAKSLEGVKDGIRPNTSGILIAGREHYFTSTSEMFAALGLRAQDTIVIRSKNEFSETEMLEYFQFRNIDIETPKWLPRRPLICQTISDLAKEQMERIFGSEGNEIEFWHHFIEVLCERDASIHILFDASVIYEIFLHLARLTRSKAANVGPISLAELQGAFEAATGAAPVEEASVMLQRLPSLGRINAESNDRQFVDSYILEGLRSADIVKACLAGDHEFHKAASAVWINPLDDLGQLILAADRNIADKSKLEFADLAYQRGNKIMACDLIAALMRSNRESIDFGKILIDSGEFLYLTFSERELRDLQIHNSYIGRLVLPAKRALNVELVGCITPRVSGIGSASGLPIWIKALQAEQYDSADSVSQIRRIKLQPAHEVLVTIIKKTFFQKGSGRKEEALLRGLGSVAARSLCNRILNILIRENLLERFRGDEGTVYVPVRSRTKRMQKILDELLSSDDEIWREVGNL